MGITYPELVAKSYSQLQRGLITQSEYEFDVMDLCQKELNRFKPWKVTLAWNEAAVGGVTYFESETYMTAHVDELISAHGMTVSRRVEMSNGSFVIIGLSEEAEGMTIVVEKQR